jgi:hypothetical protein
VARRPSTKQVRDESGRVVAVKGRRAPGGGSVYWRPDREVWVATYRVPGEERPRRVTGKTQAEAEARRSERLAELEAAGKPSRFDRSTTVAQLAAWWLDSVARHRVRASTVAKYRDRLSVARLGALASVPVVELHPEQVTSWLSDLLTGDDKRPGADRLDRAGRPLHAAPGALGRR